MAGPPPYSLPVTEDGEPKPQQPDPEKDGETPPRVVTPASIVTPEKLQEVHPVDESAPPPESPDKSQLRDWEILNGSEAKHNMREMPSKVKDIPRQVKERVMMLQPTLQEASGPFFQKLDQVLKKTSSLQVAFAERYNAGDVFEAALAAALLFAGGRFPMSIACAQSFHMACWQSMKAAWKNLRESYTSCSHQRNVEEVSWADVQRTIYAVVFAESAAQKDAALRRSLAIAKCADPNKLRDSLTGIWPGVIAALATLRSRFAYAACIGTSAGHMACGTIQHCLQVRLDTLAIENRRWADVGLQQSCRLVNFCLAFYATRIMNALNAALQGSTRLSTVLFQYVKHQQELQEIRRSTIGKCLLPLIGQFSSAPCKEQEIVKWSIAMIGFSYQIRRDFRFPMAFKVPLAPLYLMEYCLQRVAATHSF